MKHFVIYTNLHKDPERIVTDRVISCLSAHGGSCQVCVKEPDWKKEDAPLFLPEDTECIIVLGGDGTMLQAARDTVEQNIPVIGVNLGTLGFMTEIECSDLTAALLRLLRNEYQVESRMMLKGCVFREGVCRKESFALNDIVIARSGSVQMIKFNIYVNGQFLNDYSADGVIITTPTGSTGYNLSAGGPIVEPGARLMMITPVCPHTLNQRSVILSPEDVIEIEIPQGREGRPQQVEASFDGSLGVTLQTGDRIQIEKSEKTTDILKLNQESFLKVLHKKMSES